MTYIVLNSVKNISPRPKQGRVYYSNQTLEKCEVMEMKGRKITQERLRFKI